MPKGAMVKHGFPKAVVNDDWDKVRKLGYRQ